MSHADFDPELYLRLLGERALAAGEDLGHRRSQAALPEAAAALAVNGVIDPALGEEITSEYSLAAMISQESPMLRHRQPTGSPPPADPPDPEPIVAPRTYALNVSLAVPGGRLEISVLSGGADGGRFQGAFISDTQLAHAMGGGPPTLTVRLPSGHSTQTNFSGGWGDRRADGQFSFDGDLSDPLPWLEIAGHRLELPAPAAPTPAAIETFAPEGRPLRYLWQLVADFNGEHNHSRLANRAAADALLRAGLIAAEDPGLAALYWVADAMAGQGRRAFRRRRGHPPAPGTVPAGVPAPWRAVLQAPVTGPGPVGTLALAAATPVFDHLSVALNALRSTRENAILEITATPTLFGAPPGPVAFWAEDDRGNHYLGESGSWGGGGEGTTSGEIVFGPLHPKATRLTVAVTTLDARALIPVALDWPEREPAT